MALELLTSGELILTDGSNQLDGVDLTAPRAVVANLHFGGLDTCTVAAAWLVRFSVNYQAEVWRSEDIVVDNSGSSMGLVTPVIPAFNLAWLEIYLLAGVPDGLMYWDIFGL